MHTDIPRAIETGKEFCLSIIVLHFVYLYICVHLTGKNIYKEMCVFSMCLYGPVCFCFCVYVCDVNYRMPSMKLVSRC